VSWPVAWNIGFTEGYAEAYEKYGPAAVPADREALARRLRARADELGTAYADDKAMLVEAAAIIRLRSWEEAIGRRSPEGSDNF
jgi:hypothetical protein